MERVVGHVDLDYFYAQVEEVENPSIAGRPVIVCVFSGRTDDSGVVSTANYIAREFGVRSGMPNATAVRKLQGKDPVIVRLDHAKYEAVSERVMELVKPHVDILERAGIDEAFFDLTSSSRGDLESAAGTAKQIKESILREERLTCSVGLGRSKVVAKLGSEAAKPGGLIVVPSASTESFLGGMSIEKLYGVGPKTAEALREMRVTTVAELAKADITRLGETFGKKLAVYLHNAANGTDDDPVKESQAPVQFSRIITLTDDTTDPEEVMDQLADAVADLRSRLVARTTSFRTVSALVVLTDLSTKTRSRTFETPINDLSAASDAILELFVQLSETTDKEFRRVGVRVSDLSETADQRSLADFSEKP